MKIGFFTDTYFPINFGTEIAIDTFRKKLEELGEEIFVFAPRFPEYKDESPRIFRFTSFKAMSKPEFRLMLFGPKTVSKIASLKLDICHSHTIFTAGWLAQFVAKRTKIPIINQYHIFYPAYVRSRFPKILAGSAVKIAESYTRFYLNRHTAVIAPSPKIKVFLESRGVRRPIYVLPTGMDVAKFKSAKPNENWRRKYKLESEDKTLIYVGRQTPEKNVLFLIDSFKLIFAEEPRAKLILVGEGPLKPEIEKKAQAGGFGDRLIFTGRISQEETIQAYLASKIFLFASKTDTQGLVIMEAAALGLPIVALKDEAYVGMLENNQNGYTVFEEKPEAFAQAVLKILNDGELWRKFSDNSKKIAENFSDINQAKKLLDIYKTILNKR